MKSLFLWSVLFAVSLVLFLDKLTIGQPISDQRAATIDTANTALTADTTLEAATTNMRIMGWTVRESAGTAAVATAILRHGVVSGGSCSAGTVIDFIELAANGDDRQSYAPLGLAVSNGVCVQVASGEIDINIYILP